MMIFKPSLFLWTLLLLTLNTVARAGISHPGFSDLVIFSGSLSDTGNLSSLIGDLPPPFYNNRNTNGPVAVDVFAEKLGFDAEASLHLLDNSGGNNFAVTGARSGGDGPTDLPAQIDAHFARTGGAADPAALYFVFIGGHDVIEAALNPDQQASLALIDGAVSGLENQLQRLIDTGAIHLYVPGFIDIGYAPAMVQNNIHIRASWLSRRYEKRFIHMLNRLEARNSGVNFYRFSFFDFVDQHIANGAALGFTNVTDSCIDSIDCDFNRFIFLNENFPTAKVHNLLGNALALDFIHQISSCQRGNWHRSSCRKKQRYGGAW